MCDATCRVMPRMKALSDARDAAALRVNELETALRYLVACFDREREAMEAWHEAGCPDSGCLNDAADGAIEALTDAICMADEMVGDGAHDA